MKTFWRRFSIGCALLALILTIRAMGFFDWLTLAFVQEKAHEVRLWTVVHTVVGPALYMSGVFAATAFFVPVTALATIVSGYLFGIIAGTCYTIFAVMLGSIVVVLLVRYGFGRSLQREYGQYANGFNHELAHYGAYYILMIHILPMTPTVLVNILAGLSKISLWSFAWATALGILPGTIVHVLIGKELLTMKSLNDLLSWQTVGLLTLLAFLVLVPMLIDRWLRVKRVVVPSDRA
jgi:uncharacterized membrane protein YdjX (TVP38/TMEM64 family)